MRSRNVVVENTGQDDKIDDKITYIVIRIK